jgi:hypothetical protein
MTWGTCRAHASVALLHGAEDPCPIERGSILHMYSPSVNPILLGLY